MCLHNARLMFKWVVIAPPGLHRLTLSHHLRMPRRQYAPVPSSQGDAEDADRQIEDAFDISDEDHDEGQNHDNTPLLARHADAEARTPHTSRTPITRPTTSAGLCNFDYDFPPSGSPPADLAIPNSWGNTNGVIVSNPVNYNHNAQGSWVTRVWRRVVGGRQGVDPDVGRIGGGTNNDGVFSNLSSRPTARINRPSTVAQNGAEADESIFHAPELARDDAPPSYAAAQADTAPPYWENTVVTTTPDDFLIDSIPAGSIMAFIWVRTRSVCSFHSLIILTIESGNIRILGVDRVYSSLYAQSIPRWALWSKGRSRHHFCSFGVVVQIAWTRLERK